MYTLSLLNAKNALTHVETSFSTSRCIFRNCRWSSYIKVMRSRSKSRSRQQTSTRAGQGVVDRRAFLFHYIFCSFSLPFQILWRITTICFYSGLGNIITYLLTYLNGATDQSWWRGVIWSEQNVYNELRRRRKARQLCSASLHCKTSKATRRTEIDYN